MYVELWAWIKFNAAFLWLFYERDKAYKACERLKSIGKAGKSLSATAFFQYPKMKNLSSFHKIDKLWKISNEKAKGIYIFDLTIEILKKGI